MRGQGALGGGSGQSTSGPRGATGAGRRTIRYKPRLVRSPFESLTFGISWLGCPIMACTARSVTSFDIPIFVSKRLKSPRLKARPRENVPALPVLSPKLIKKSDVGVESPARLLRTIWTTPGVRGGDSDCSVAIRANAIHGMDRSGSSFVHSR